MLPIWIDANTPNSTAIDNAHQDTPNRFTYTAFVSARLPTEITNTADNLHYNATGQRTLADRYYTALGTI